MSPVNRNIVAKTKIENKGSVNIKNKKAEFTPNENLPVVECVGKKLKAPEVWSDEKGKVTTDYQDYLEAEWIKTLRAKYPVVLNQEVWERIKK